jgi:hypothetical protein
MLSSPLSPAQEGFWSLHDYISSFNVLPEVFDGVEVRPLRRPGEHLQSAFFPGSGGKLGTVRWSVIFLEDTITTRKNL